MRCALLLAGCLVVWSLAAPASGQEFGEIFGRVTDASGALMPGVRVTATSPVLLDPIVVITSPTGSYRLPRLPISIYTVTFERIGFKTIVREGIRLEIGFNAQINATIELSLVEETVTVPAETPIIDVRDTSTGARVTYEGLQSIPSARDPWVVIEQTPGVRLDRENVGGNWSGQQSVFNVRASGSALNKWILDGVDITDPATISSPFYYDFDSFEEMRVTTGGSSGSMGVTTSIVTKSGGDQLRGTLHGYYVSGALQANNVSDEMRRQGATSGSPVKRISDYGVEAGGPISRGRAWFWGAYGKQDIRVGVLNYFQKTPACEAVAADPLAYPVGEVNDCLNPDITTIQNVNAKVSLAPLTNNRFTWHTSFSSKSMPTRGASDLRPIETTWRQGSLPSSYGGWGWKSGPAGVWKARDQHTFSDRLMLEAQWAHVNNNFGLLGHTDAQRDAQVMYELSTRAWARSYYQASFVRPTNTASVSFNYLASGLLGGDHAITAGYTWWRGEAFSELTYGGNVIARFSSGAQPDFSIPYSARFYRDSLTDYLTDSHAVTIQDTYTRRRLTLNAGLSLVHVRDRAAPHRVPASPFMGQLSAEGQPFTFLPAIDFVGASADVPHLSLAPSVVVSYDLTADTRNVVKASYARNYPAVRTFSSALNPISATWVEFPWNDSNHDTKVQMNEVSFARLIRSGGNFNASDPASMVTANKVDPSLKLFHIDEAVVGYERELAGDLGVGASYIWRRYSDFTRNFNFDPVTGRVMSSSDWNPVTFTPAAASCPVEGARCETVTYYTPSFPIPTSYVTMTAPGFFKTYKGLELTLRKRMSHGWMLNASLTLDNAREFFPSPDSYQDPTNIEQRNGGRFTEQSTTLDTVYIDTTWIARANGAYRLPWYDIGIAGFYNARSGYPFVQSVLIASRPNRAGSILTYLDEVGAVRLDTFQSVDLRVDKTFTIGRARVQAILDVFNLTNASTVLSRRQTQNANNANQISAILAPRVLRFGARVLF